MAPFGSLSSIMFSMVSIGCALQRNKAHQTVFALTKRSLLLTIIYHICGPAVTQLPLYMNFSPEFHTRGR